MAKTPDPLETYNKKRDFKKTAEPAGKRGRKSGPSTGSGQASFLVQKHDATRLHYDLRLEKDGVLKSWAVTRGPSLDPADKRLSVRTEDHPLSYGDFEGTIPKGEYGGGTVMLWDRGTWAPIAGKSADDLEDGHLHFTIDGARMKGEWLLVRMKGKPKEKRENWLLRKVEDGFAGGSDGLTGEHLTSIKTGRTMDEIARDVKPVPRRKPGPSSTAQLDPGFRRGTAGAKPPAFRKLQLATLVDAVPSGSTWLHEMKYDGYRCLLSIGGGAAKVFTRTGLDWSEKFPEIVAAARGIDVGSALLDGEIVSLDDQGRTGFSALQQAISDGGTGLTLFLFDALEIDGESLVKLPNIERKARLAALLGEGRPPVILYAEHIVGAGETLLDAMCAAGQEGIIAKRADAPYRGARTKNWLKVKCTRRQEFVVIGWAPSDKPGRAFRSLLLGLHENGALRYAGKVGTGFSGDTMRDLAASLKRIERKTAPTEVPRSEARGAHWVKPELVAEIAFAEFTSENVVRHASFLGLRGDKKAAAVVAEKPAAAPRAEPADDVRISNPDRVIFPDSDVTKGDLADYYRQVGSIMLPFAGDRPISLVRCPQGRGKHCFFQKHDAGSFGEYVRKVPIKEKDGGTEDYLYVADTPGLLACVQMGTIEFHGWGSKVGKIETPDRLVFDLDPDEGLGFDAVKKAAHDLRRHLDDMGLVTYPMLTGGKGVHVVAPLTGKAKWPAVKDFAQRFALALAEAEPDRFTATMSKAKRKGRIFLDWLRNQRGSTAIMPYSARAREGAPVAAPILWSELDDCATGARFSVRDADMLLERASSRDLQGWGIADQALPDA